MKYEINDRDRKILFSKSTLSLKLCVEAAIKAGANLSRADLSEANLSRADLSGANLSRANLSRANLSRADLSGADLSEANLSRANLSRADLSGANLSRANLSRADLSRADLSEANLSRANLSRADLSEANLSRANLSRANLSRADLSGANLSRAKGLINATDWLMLKFKSNKKGLVVYKAFGDTFRSPPEHWEIKKGKYIEETANACRTDDCGSGVNFATLDWVKGSFKGKEVVIRECILHWKDLAGCIVPYNTDGKARCGRLEIGKIVRPK